MPSEGNDVNDNNKRVKQKKGTGPSETTSPDPKQYKNIARGRHHEMTINIKEDKNQTDVPSKVTPQYKSKMMTSEANNVTKLGMVQILI